MLCHISILLREGTTLQLVIFSALYVARTGASYLTLALPGLANKNGVLPALLHVASPS